MRIIRASRRTDIAAFYTPWLLNRFAAGFCEHRNRGKSRRLTGDSPPELHLSLLR